MANFWMLVKYEYKKILQKRIVWISIGVMCLVGLFCACIPYMQSYSVNGKTITGYEMVKEENKKNREQSGTKIDNALFEKMRSNSKSIAGEMYAVTYNGIYSVIYQIMGLDFDENNLDEKTLYQTRESAVQGGWETAGLTSGEKAYLQGLEEEAEIPIVYEYADGYDNAKNMLAVIGLLQVLLAAICIPGIFADEHTRKTDQLVLCTNLGRKQIYLAKIFTGITFSVITTIGITLTACIPTFIIFGAEGFTASAQMINPLFSWDITAGEVFLIIAGLCILAAVLHCAAAMLIAEWSRSSVVPMAVMVGIMLASMLFNVPDQYRTLAQAWDCLPGNVISAAGPFGVRLFHVFGRYLATWQAVPFIWLVIIAAMLVFGYKLYRNYQVSGR